MIRSHRLRSQEAGAGDARWLLVHDIGVARRALRTFLAIWLAATLGLLTILFYLERDESGLRTSEVTVLGLLVVGGALLSRKANRRIEYASKVEYSEAGLRNRLKTGDVTVLWHEVQSLSISGRFALVHGASSEIPLMLDAMQSENGARDSIYRHLDEQQALRVRQ